jgi:hypothetical protein
MTNMPAEPAPLWPFGITLLAICIPFFSLIGFLSTNFGYGIWVAKTKQLYRWLRPKSKVKLPVSDDEFEPHLANRTMSAEEGMRMRMGGHAVRGNEGHTRKERKQNYREGHRDSLSHPHIRKMVEAMGEGRAGGPVQIGTMVESGDETAGLNGRVSKDTVVRVNDD